MISEKPMIHFLWIRDAIVCVFVLLNFNKEDSVDRKEEKGGMYQDNDEEDMEYVRLDEKRERHWRMVLEENYGEVENEKALLHAKRWVVYINNKRAY